MESKVEIEKDGVKLTLEPNSTDTLILIEINGEYVGDIRPEIDANGEHAVIHTRLLSQPSNFSRHSYRIDKNE